MVPAVTAAEHDRHTPEYRSRIRFPVVTTGSVTLK
jgi:hypothetical protein